MDAATPSSKDPRTTATGGSSTPRKVKKSATAVTSATDQFATPEKMNKKAAAASADLIYMYGGYIKEVSSDKNASEKGTVHADMWSLDPRTWEWNKVKKTGMPPGPRAGFSMCVHKKKVVLFGGIVDMEVEADVLMSMFMNELYGFQLDNHRWYPLELKKDEPAKIRQRISKERIQQMIQKVILVMRTMIPWITRKKLLMFNLKSVEFLIT